VTALILTPFSGQPGGLDAARQEYRLAQEHYREVCRGYDARCPHAVERFRAALERKNDAWERYMAAMWR
jgi:hypothetical protein